MMQRPLNEMVKPIRAVKTGSCKGYLMMEARPVVISKRSSRYRPKRILPNPGRKVNTGKTKQRNDYHNHKDFQEQKRTFFNQIRKPTSVSNGMLDIFCLSFAEKSEQAGSKHLG